MLYLSSGSAGRILIADDSATTRALLDRVLTARGFEVCAVADGDAALTAVAHERPDLVLADVVMPGLDGYELCRRLKADPDTRLTPVVLVTGLGDRESRIAGLEAGADDFLTKPLDSHELLARVRSLVRLKRYTDALETADALIRSLALAVEARDPNVVGHCERMAAYVTWLGRRLGLCDHDLTVLEQGAYLHDVGKIGIPDAILMKRGRLMPAEFEIMKTHVLIGERLCAGLHSLSDVKPIIRCHHERIDGSGYPEGLTGAGIPLSAQLISVVDVYDALTTDRPYRSALPAEAALRELTQGAARGLFRQDLVAAFEETLRR